MFQCPFGHSGILTEYPGVARADRDDEFQCPFGHSGILTEARESITGASGEVSMPFRAFGDSDTTLRMRPRAARGVSMPFRAFGDSDFPIASPSETKSCVSMPFRAFGDSDEAPPRRSLLRGGRVSMPFRAFGDSDAVITTLAGVICALGFNALSGIRGF